MLIAFLMLVGETEQMPQKVSASVKATTVILRAEEVTADLWKYARRKSERLYVERDGTRVLLRTIEHE